MKYRLRLTTSTYEVEIDDLHSRPIVAVVDGEPFEVWPEEPEAAGSARPGLR